MMFDSVKCCIEDALYWMDNNYDLDSTILKDCADVLIVLHEDVLVNRTSSRWRVPYWIANSGNKLYEMYGELWVLYWWLCENYRNNLRCEFLVCGTISVLSGRCAKDMLRSCCCRNSHHHASDLQMQRSQIIILVRIVGVYVWVKSPMKLELISNWVRCRSYRSSVPQGIQL